MPRTPPAKSNWAFLLETEPVETEEERRAQFEQFQYEIACEAAMEASMERFERLFGGEGEPDVEYDDEWYAEDEPDDRETTEQGWELSGEERTDLQPEVGPDDSETVELGGEELTTTPSLPASPTSETTEQDREEPTVPQPEVTSEESDDTAAVCSESDEPSANGMDNVFGSASVDVADCVADDAALRAIVEFDPPTISMTEDGETNIAYPQAVCEPESQYLPEGTEWSREFEVLLRAMCRMSCHCTIHDNETFDAELRAAMEQEEQDGNLCDEASWWLTTGLDVRRRMTFDPERSIEAAKRFLLAQYATLKDRDLVRYGEIVTKIGRLTREKRHPMLNDEYEREPVLVKPEVVIDGLLRRRQIANLIGQSKVSKTFVAMTLALAVASDDAKWFGRDVLHGNVVYVDLELEQWEARERFELIAEALRIDYAAARRRIQLRSIINEDTSIERLTRDIVADAQNFNLAIIDPIYLLFNPLLKEHENDPVAVARLYREVRNLAQRTDAAVVLLHHDPKGDPSMREVTARGSGSGIMGRIVNTIMTLTRVKDSRNIMFDAEARSFPSTHMELRRISENGPPIWVPVCENDEEGGCHREGEKIRMSWAFAEICARLEPETKAIILGRADQFLNPGTRKPITRATARELFDRCQNENLIISVTDPADKRKKLYRRRDETREEEIRRQSQEQLAEAAGVNRATQSTEADADEHEA